MKNRTKAKKPQLPPEYTRYSLLHTARAEDPKLIDSEDRILLGISLFSHKHEGEALKALWNYCIHYYSHNKIDILVAGTLQRHCFWHLVKSLDQEKKLEDTFSNIHSFFPDILDWKSLSDQDQLNSDLNRSDILELLAKALAKTLYVAANNAQDQYIKKNFPILTKGAKCPILRWDAVVPDLENHANQSAEKIRFANYFEFLTTEYLADQQSNTGIYKAFNDTIEKSIDLKKSDGKKKYNLVISTAKLIFQSNRYLTLLVDKLIEKEVDAQTTKEDKLNQFILDLYNICSRNFLLEESTSLLDLLDRGYTAVVYPSNISPAFKTMLDKYNASDLRKKTHSKPRVLKWCHIVLDQVKPKKENYADSSDNFGREEKIPLSPKSANLEMDSRSSLTRYRSHAMRETIVHVKSLAIAASKKEEEKRENCNLQLASGMHEYQDPLEVFEKRSYPWMQSPDFTTFKALLARIRYLADLEMWRVHNENPSLTARYHYDDQLTTMLAQTSSEVTATQLSDMLERIRYTVSEIDKDRYRGRCFQVEYETVTGNDPNDELFNPFIIPDFPTELIPDYYELSEYSKYEPSDEMNNEHIKPYIYYPLQFNITLVYEIPKCEASNNVPPPHLKEVKLGTPIVFGSKPNPHDPRLSFPIRLNFFSHAKDNVILTAKFNLELCKIGFFSSSWQSAPVKDPDGIVLSSKIRGCKRYPWKTTELKRYIEIVSEGINSVKQEVNLNPVPKRPG